MRKKVARREGQRPHPGDGPLCGLRKPSMEVGRPRRGPGEPPALPQRLELDPQRLLVALQRLVVLPLGIVRIAHVVVGIGHVRVVLPGGLADRPRRALGAETRNLWGLWQGTLATPGKASTIAGLGGTLPYKPDQTLFLGGLSLTNTSPSTPPRGSATPKRPIIFA
ncbi:hypothetical protein M569_17690 [Genlisea aurea]|uniref:Uncharacterized protein n=1 Tax=Genlisea aurea TaxID=192259 RepID=S8DCP6_9LAMI|nr:hypothetical protein M569_17690 [Genlisea aurea]